MDNERVLLRVLRAAQQPRAATQSQMARKAGLTTARYWEIENGEGKSTSADERHAVAAAFGVDESTIAWPQVHPRLQAQAS